jgi:hypothetical protein
MTEYVVRFFLGGLVVSAFAMLGDILRPKSFAGLFGAALRAPGHGDRGFRLMATSISSR